MTLHVMLRGTSTVVAVQQACVERSPVLQLACQRDENASVRLPSDLSVWDDWANERGPGGVRKDEYLERSVSGCCEGASAAAVRAGPPAGPPAEPSALLARRTARWH